MNTNSRILMVLGTIIMILGITEILQAQNEVDNEDIYRWYLNIGGDPRDDYPVADGAIFTENIAIPPENNFGLADLPTDVYSITFAAGVDVTFDENVSLTITEQFYNPTVKI